MFHAFSVNPIIRETNRVVKRKKPKKAVFRPFFDANLIQMPINRGFASSGV
jgi:hypothetical protein